MSERNIQEEIELQKLRVSDLVDSEGFLAGQMNHQSMKVTELFKEREKARKKVVAARAKLADLYVEAGAFRVILPEKLPRCSCEKVSVQIGTYDAKLGVEVRSSLLVPVCQTPLGFLDALALEPKSPFGRKDAVVLHSRLYRFIDGKWTIIPFETEVR